MSDDLERRLREMAYADEHFPADANGLMVEAADALAQQRQRITGLEGALQRIQEMSVRPHCVCGVPTGTAAIEQCARAALGAPTTKERE